MAIPVHIVTGFLGAGKTTFLNRLLKSGSFSNTAIIINEFGDIGIDHLLVEEANAGDQMIELSDGCLCCTVRGDLVDTLERIAERVNDGMPVDRVIIETTGLADPVPVLQAVMAAPSLLDTFRVASVVTIVCAATGLRTLEDHREARQQIAFADSVIIAKTDLPGAEIARLTERLAALNPRAVPADANAPGFRFNLDDEGLSGVHLDKAAHASDHGDHHHHHGHDVNRHGDGIEAFTLTHDAPIPLATVGMFIDLLRSSMPDQLLRVKGIVRTPEEPDRPMVIHGVRSVFQPPAFLQSWKGKPLETRLVVITLNGNRRRVADLFAAFTGQAVVDAPDRQALTDNPLAIPGM
jgi:G3E family GTPase